jgi:hypothetical protein
LYELRPYESRLLTAAWYDIKINTKHQKGF